LSRWNAATDREIPSAATAASRVVQPVAPDRSRWLVDWPIYLAPEIDDLIPGNAHQAMLMIGVIEIVAGLVVAVRPKWGGYLVAAWLGGIIVNLLVLGDYYDVALRDFGLLLAALALARLATAEERSVALRRSGSTEVAPFDLVEP
jgi:hypothetical protein